MTAPGLSANPTLPRGVGAAPDRTWMLLLFFIVTSSLLLVSHNSGLVDKLGGFGTLLKNPIVEAFVHGNTRGRGFKNGRPVAPLQAVVVTAAARLVTNPEQVYQYTTADYSERPAVLNGWTIPERGILHNYRKRAGSCG